MGQGQEIVSCPFGKKEPERLGFDITEDDKLVDMLLQQGKIKLSRFHTIPSAEELKRMKYCKWHNSTSTTPMIARSSDNRFNKLLSKGNSSSKPLQKLKSR
jgi:hypothetical protein